MRYARDGWSVEVGIKKGRPPPSWYLEQPHKGPLDDFWLAAFWTLSTCRQIGFSTGPIPWRDVVRYAEYVGLDRENADALEVIIRELDGAYLGHIAEEQGKQREQEKAKAQAEAEAAKNRMN
jgi:hypothetical protein